MTDQPDVNDLFPAKSTDDLFPPDVERERYRRQTLGTSPIQDLIFGNTDVNPVARVLDHFGQGFKQSWGDSQESLSKQTEETLKVNKQFDAWNEGKSSIVKAANDTLFRPAAVQFYHELRDAEALGRAASGLFTGAQAAVAQIGAEFGAPSLGKEISAIPEAFMGTPHPTGIPKAPGKYIQSELARQAPAEVPAVERVMAADQADRVQNAGGAETRILMDAIERAKELKVIGAGEEGYFGTAAIAPESAAKVETPKPQGMPVDLFMEPKEAARPVEAPRPVEPAAVEPGPTESATPIAADVTQKLIAAGRPEAEARAAGELIASHYEARAERFGGERGTAEQLYVTEGADIRSGDGTAPARSEAIRPPEAVDWTERLRLKEKTEQQLQDFITVTKQHVSNFERTINDPFEQKRQPKATLDHYAEQARIGHEGIVAAENELGRRSAIGAEPVIPPKTPVEGGAAEPITTVPQLKKALRGRAAADPQTWSLYEFLAKEGGLKPTADLKSIMGGKNPFVPGFGPLLRESGLTMDEALTRAKENSYIIDPNDIQHTPGAANTGELTKSVNDLQDMIAEESRGRKNYRTDHTPKEKAIDLEEERASIVDALHREVKAAGGKVDPALEDRVVEIVQKEGVSDVHDAYERAILEDHDRHEGLLNDRRNTKETANVRGHDAPDSGAAPDTLKEFVDDSGYTWSSEQEARAANVGEPRGHGANDRAAADLELNQIKRGKINLRNDAKPIITLFKDANASTFIHETGHHWLEELMKDSEHPLAPAELKGDAIKVLDWLGVPTADAIKTSHHEKFARGFERYMMEGKAPNQALANVFARFRDWLTKIYQTVNRLKSPINDEIRGVFDRLLTMHPSEVKIEPEGPAKTFADVHEADAIHTAPEAAHPVAETIQAERDMLAAEHIPEEHDARLEGVASKADRREAGGPQPVRDGNEAEPLAGEGGNDQASGAVGESGSNASPESARPSVGGGKTEPPVSAQDTFAGPDSALVDKAGNIRLDNLGTAEDVNKAIRDAAAENNDFIDARRGVVTDGQVLELADALGMDAGQINTRKLGEAYNAEQIMAARKLLIQSATTVRDAMVKAAEGAEVDIMAYAEAKARHQMIQEQVSGITAEAGRALRAFRRLEGQAEAGQIDAFLKDATGKTLFQLQREAQLGSQLPTPAQVSKFVNDSAKPTWKEMVIEAWITALLSGPKTHIANIMGNTISGLWRPVETATSAAIGTVRSLVTGSQDRVLFGEAAAELFGMVHGSKEGVVAAYKAFRSEEPQLTGVRQIEQGHPKALPSATVTVLGREMEIGGKQARIPLRLLGAEDEFFKSVAFRGDINRQAYAIAAKENLPPEQFNARVAELSMAPTEEMIGKAKDVAEYQTFQTPLGKVGRSVQNFANSHILAKFIVPFVRTPINLLKYAGERTPLGLFAQEVRDNLSGKYGAVARDTQVARITLGTMVGVAAFELASQGLVTGGGPSDKAKKAIMQADGWQEYSVKIGDMYYKYSRLDPFSVILGLAADSYEISHALGSEHLDKEHIPALIFAAVTKNILNRASLQGPSDLIQAVSDPERYGKGYVKGMAGTVIPAFSAQTAQAMDPVVREARTVLDGIKARIPGLSESLMPKRDIWGEPTIRGGGLGPDIASPIMERRILNDPVNQALLAANYFPGKLDRKIRGVELTDQQYDDYARTAGRMAKTRLNAIVAIPGFAQMPESTRKELMTSAITTSREASRSLIMMQNPEIIKKAMDAKIVKLRGEPAH